MYSLCDEKDSLQNASDFNSQALTSRGVWCCNCICVRYASVFSVEIDIILVIHKAWKLHLALITIQLPFALKWWSSSLDQKPPGSMIQKEDLIEISLSKTSLVEMNLYHAPSAWQ